MAFLRTFHASPHVRSKSETIEKPWCVQRVLPGPKAQYAGPTAPLPLPASADAHCMSAGSVHAHCRASTGSSEVKTMSRSSRAIGMKESDAHASSCRGSIRCKARRAVQLPWGTVCHVQRGHVHVTGRDIEFSSHLQLGSPKLAHVQL